MYNNFTMNENIKFKVTSEKRGNKNKLAQWDSVETDGISMAETVMEGPFGDLLVLCTYCGKLYVPTRRAVCCRKSSINGKASGEQRLYCSEACKEACPSYRQKDDWKSNKPATSREVSAQFRQLVLARDEWTCQKCGAGTDSQLHVHHIEGATQQPGLSNDLENGITLCKKCHREAHSEKGCHYVDLRCPVK